MEKLEIEERKIITHAIMVRYRFKIFYIYFEFQSPKILSG
jgi:hypothetical protein